MGVSGICTGNALTSKENEMNTTKTAQFTPGPWFTDNYFDITSSSGDVIVRPPLSILENDRIHPNECRANANLIAAAPAMYEALKEWCDYYAAYNPIRDKRIEPFIQLTRKALAQAEGKAL